MPQTPPVSALRAKHADALWRLEKIWQRLGPRDYHDRRKLTSAAAKLGEIGAIITKLEQAQP